MARLSIIEIDQLPAMEVLEVIDSENILNSRMDKFVELWRFYDPPAGAQYDVDLLEFDPIKITQESSTFFELLLRDRVNQAARSVTLAYAFGGDLEAIASRYPGGVPRLPGETDDHYRMRVWLSPNTLSPHGVYEAYVFWALTAAPELRDVTATAKPGNPTVTITLMANGPPVTVGIDGKSVTAFPSPVPTIAQIDAVRSYELKDSRKAMTDVLNIQPAKIVNVNYSVRYWLFPGWAADLLEKQLYTAAAALIEKQRWLGYSHVQAAMEAALKTSGVFNVIVDTPLDTIVDKNTVVQVQSVKLIYAGRAGFEEPIEPN